VLRAVSWIALAALPVGSCDGPGIAPEPRTLASRQAAPVLARRVPAAPVAVAAPLAEALPRGERAEPLPPATPRAALRAPTAGRAQAGIEPAPPDLRSATAPGAQADAAAAEGVSLTRDDPSSTAAATVDRPEPLLIAAVATNRPIELPPLVQLASVPERLAEAPIAAEAAELAVVGPAPSKTTQVVARPSTPSLPAEAQTEGRRNSLVLALDEAPGLPGDERAYVPQISVVERQAYVAQLDLESLDNRLAVRIGGKVVGGVLCQVSDGHIAVNIGQVLDLFEGRMAPARFAALRESPAAREFVPLDVMHRAGIPLEYDAAYDELVLRGSSG
jgi:hypothetical protein